MKGNLSGGGMMLLILIVSGTDFCLGRLEPAGDDFSDHSVFLRSAASTLLGHEATDTDEPSSFSRVRKTKNLCKFAGVDMVIIFSVFKGQTRSGVSGRSWGF